MNEARARNTYGRRQERTTAELEKLCGEAFRALKIPENWKFEVYDRCRLWEDPASEIQSIGAWFLDTKTRGIDLKRYRIAFHTYSERLSITEKTIIDYGKYKHQCIGSNCTPAKAQEVIARLAEAPPTTAEATNDNDDGLQHIRDRLRNMEPAAERGKW